jgi:hypothetical protein
MLIYLSILYENSAINLPQFFVLIVFFAAFNFPSMFPVSFSPYIEGDSRLSSGMSYVTRIITVSNKCNSQIPKVFISK